MRRYRPYLFVILLLFAATIARATIFGSVQGIVHDPQHRPIPDASVKLKSATSDWTQTAQIGPGRRVHIHSRAIRRLLRDGDEGRFGKYAANRHSGFRIHRRFFTFN